MGLVRDGWGAGFVRQSPLAGLIFLRFFAYFLLKKVRKELTAFDVCIASDINNEEAR